MYSRKRLIGAAYKALRVPPDSIPLDSLAFCPFCLEKGPDFALLPLGLKGLLAALILLRNYLSMES